MNTVRFAWLMFQKDFQSELRSGEVTLTTALFSVILAVLVSISFYFDKATALRLTPGVIWVTIAFSGLLVMARVWSREREHGMFRALLLSPIPRASIYLGKGAASFLFLTLVELLFIPVVGILFHAPLNEVALELALLVGLGSFGFVAMGTLFSAVTVQSRVRDFVFALVLFPLIAPALLAGVVATRELLLGASLSQLGGWLQILTAFAVMSLASGVLLFNSLTTD